MLSFLHNSQMHIRTIELRATAAVLLRFASQQPPIGSRSDCSFPYIIQWLWFVCSSDICFSTHYLFRRCFWDTIWVDSFTSTQIRQANIPVGTTVPSFFFLRFLFDHARRPSLSTLYNHMLQLNTRTTRSPLLSQAKIISMTATPTITLQHIKNSEAIAYTTRCLLHAFVYIPLHLRFLLTIHRRKFFGNEFFSGTVKVGCVRENKETTTKLPFQMLTKLKTTNKIWKEQLDANTSCAHVVEMNESWANDLKRPVNFLKHCLQRNIHFLQIRPQASMHVEPR